MTYTPSKQVLENYADVLVNFALGGGKGIKKGDVVLLRAPEAAKPLFCAVYNTIVESGGHVIPQYMPSDNAYHNVTRDFYERARGHQLDYFPAKFYRGLVDEIDHSIAIFADEDPHALTSVDPKRIMRRGIALKQFRDWRDKKEHAGKFTWTLALYGTPAMAKEAGLSERAYWNQIINACFLKDDDPIKTWRQVYRDIEKYRKKLNALAPKVEWLHVEGPDADLWIKHGKERQWLAGIGRNIPSFEIFASPDWRGAEGWIRFNQPLYRYGCRIEGIELEFKNGKVVKSRARKNERILKEMVRTPGADKIGEFSLTDKRHSRITKFMADTLFDENMGGPQGNTHIALGAAYTEAFAGDVNKLTKKRSQSLGFNDSSVHTDIISTMKRVVTAHLTDGSTKVIYKNGQFTL